MELIDKLSIIDFVGFVYRVTASFFLGKFPRREFLLSIDRLCILMIRVGISMLEAILKWIIVKNLSIGSYFDTKKEYTK